MNEEVLRKCLILSVVDIDGDPSICPRIPLIVSRCPSAGLCLLCFWGPNLLLSLEDVLRSCFAHTSRTRVPGNMCPPWVTLASACRWESIKHSLLVQSWSILWAELQFTLQGSCEGWSETLPKIPCWLGFFAFSDLPPQSFAGFSQEHSLFHLLIHKSHLGVCFQGNWLRSQRQPWYNCLGPSSWQLDDYKNIHLPSIFLDSA